MVEASAGSRRREGVRRKGEVRQNLAARQEHLAQPWVQWKPQEDSEKRKGVTWLGCSQDLTDCVWIRLRMGTREEAGFCRPHNAWSERGFRCSSDSLKKHRETKQDFRVNSEFTRRWQGAAFVSLRHRWATSALSSILRRWWGCGPDDASGFPLRTHLLFWHRGRVSAKHTPRDPGDGDRWPSSHQRCWRLRALEQTLTLLVLQKQNYLPPEDSSNYPLPWSLDLGPLDFFAVFQSNYSLTRSLDVSFHLYFWWIQSNSLCSHTLQE